MQYADYSTRELQESLTPDQVVQILRDGNDRFRAGQPLTRDLTRQLEATAENRHPLAIVLSGASSRTPVEMIFDMGLGDIFCARVTGKSGERRRVGQPGICLRRGGCQVDPCARTRE